MKHIVIELPEDSEFPEVDIILESDGTISVPWWNPEIQKLLDFLGAKSKLKESRYCG